MKIALLTDGIYPNYIGGMQKHSAFVAKYLAASGVDVQLYSRCPPGVAQLDASGNNPRISRYYIPFPTSLYFPGHYLWQSYGYSTLIYEQLKCNLDVDFIYAQGFTAWRLLKEKRKGLKTPPVGVNFHGFDMYQRAPSFKGLLQQKMLRPFVASMLRSSEVAFSLGGGVDEILASIGISRERIYRSPNGVESTWLKNAPTQPHGPRRFVFVGRYARLKGVEELSAVIEDLAKDRAECHFDFVGPIPESLRSHHENVTYWGTVTDTEKMQEIMRNCDVLLCPSHAEGMPTVILEAMASGLAVIASDVGAISSMMSKENGWLIAPGDLRQLKQAILGAIAASPGVLMAMKCESLKRAQEFTWESVIDMTIAEIRRAIKNSAQRTVPL